MTSTVIQDTQVMHGDAIAAIATPPGVSGIAVIRVSGDGSIGLVDRLFAGSKRLVTQETHTAHVGYVVDTAGKTLDQVVATVFRSPHSYTGEDSVELSCHGGSTVSRAVLQRCFTEGIRHAEPGEFTRRAFINGKMDLAQAEAVADLIHSQSEDARGASMRQLEGKLSQYVSDLRESLIHAASMLELTLDFAEEDVDFLQRQQLKEELDRVSAKLRTALGTYSSGKVIRDGVRVVIVGKPNSGKSSLLNALLNTTRAIVTDIPGTTRDYIEEAAMVDGELFRFIDTAGIRSTEDAVEMLGIQYSKELLNNSDITCCLIDGTAERIDNDRIGEITREFKDAGVDPETAMYAVNKVDLMTDISSIPSVGDEAILGISALTGEGLNDLRKMLGKRARSMKKGHEGGEVLVTNIRHAECLRRSIESVSLAREALAENRTEEFLALEVRQAIDALGEIIGEVVTDDILNSIFTRFCIGK